MKKFFVLCAMALMSVAASAQNLQVHYDFGRHIYPNKEDGRQAATLTFEHFKADKSGSWYYFIDLDIDKKAMSAAYTEISREANVYKVGDLGTIATHVEYDAGLNRSMSYQQAGLIGVVWNGHNTDFSKTYSLQVMYKQIFGDKNPGHKKCPSFQVTGVWGLKFLSNQLTFSGFFDVWSEKASKRYMVFLSEPQLWYTPLRDKNTSIGTEIELSYNFPYNNKQFFINPTLAVKYNF